MVLHNPNNWHWVNKDVSPWAREYLENDLQGISAEENGVSAKIDKIISMDGDVDVSQRKGKVITLFDVKLQVEYSGKSKDGAEASGTITIPEVAHDTEEDEYVFEIGLYSESSSTQPVKDLVRSKITPQLRKHLQKLGPALIAEHGKDLQHPSGSNPSSGFSTPKYVSNTSIPKQGDNPKDSPKTSTSNTGKGPSVNVTTVTDNEEFRTTAEELYKTFTDPQRIAAFTRSAPKTFEGAHPGGKFELFGGNVSGEYETLEPPTTIIQKWRLAQWPQGHFSTLKIRFEQNDVDAVTVMRVDWEGVPIGQEEVTKRNWGEYYVRSIKTTFGFGTVL
ncbi:hypothetical protein W97_06314 [Coniosporium apollinis CBS 100218]|uniref:Activator of Hsp90 ATPase AHSA1-like N-terminal domain-containing protein n=1 Tax=Coniosporium apollinis (strain CBS 100218) TaxID=1168221 RepID=R7YZ08_CONA1|nr:uncharacterized protein W97_06314 [Coniosporium apollinis CBS 100218]EON66911.1 hypothetical protein W97_06314 [Coniosporium apollinis CBS 100218]